MYVFVRLKRCFLFFTLNLFPCFKFQIVGGQPEASYGFLYVDNGAESERVCINMDLNQQLHRSRSFEHAVSTVYIVTGLN